MKRMFFFEKVYSRWFILLIDQAIITLSFSIALVIIWKVNYDELFNYDLLVYLLAYNLISMAVFIGMRIHTGIIRYSNIGDIFRVFKGVLLSSVLFGLIAYLNRIPSLELSRSWFLTMLTINFFISTSILIVVRIGVKAFYLYLKAMQIVNREALLIYGADRISLLIKQGLDSSPEDNVEIFGFIDDNPDRTHKSIEQIRVYPSSSIGFLKEKYAIEKMIVMEDCPDIEGRKKAIEKCIELGIRVISVPPSAHWLNGKLKLRQFADLKIEDLLQRDPILLENENIKASLSGKRILVTGAAGSIGSEIVRQVMKCNPGLVVLCDQAETPLHEMQLEVADNSYGCEYRVVMVNIQNRNRLENLFKEHKPDIIFHAAALKHVPMMECNPAEAILTNVLGTKNLADLSLIYGVEKFIMISTDKAVKPTNVMGASKRIAEIYIQSLQNNTAEILLSTKFITTRFGNVLGSNGSVVPRFKAQIESGGPVTVTDPDVTRYFMTIPEAVQLVLEASAMGNGGEIFIFDMGKPIRILDLAIKMIKLAGFSPYTDIKISFTGLRPGEKLYEELLNQTELVVPTYNEKIKISAVIYYPYLYVQKVIDELLALNNLNNDKELIRKMKEIVPDYQSSNIIYMDQTQFVS